MAPGLAESPPRPESVDSVEQNERLAECEQRLTALGAKGKVSYVDIASACYGPGSSAQIQAARAYQQANPSLHFGAAYDDRAINETHRVKESGKLAQMGAMSSVSGDDMLTAKGIDQRTRGVAMSHEGQHLLFPQADLRALESRNPTERLRDPRLYPDFVRQNYSPSELFDQKGRAINEGYHSNVVELAQQLSEVNRAFALLGPERRVTHSAADTIAALQMLGAEVREDSLRGIFERENKKFPEAAFSTPPSQADRDALERIVPTALYLAESLQLSGKLIEANQKLHTTLLEQGETSKAQEVEAKMSKLKAQYEGKLQYILERCAGYACVPPSDIHATAAA